MPKITIKNNVLEDQENDFFSIQNNTIILKKSEEYVLEYTTCQKIELEIKIAPNVLAKLFIISIDNNLEVKNHYYLEKNSELILSKFYYNYSIKEVEKVNLNGCQSFFSSNFSSISRGIEEYHIIVNHNAKSVTSKISNKCIGLDKSSITLDINSNLEKGNTDCIMDQTSRILTLGEVNATIIPNMFIDENSVEAKHGSVIGGFQEDEIFYLMSRGIPYEEARNLLIKGFIFSNLMVDMEKRAKILSIIQNIRGE